MTRVLDLARRAGQSEAKVLITGESGVGKDLMAREIHHASKRSGRPFVAVNCAGVPETLLESELFGHVRGSFTGAYRDRPGKLQLADGGTLFLDEVGEMTLRMQSLLLRFLESGEIQTIGDSQARTLNVRIVAATNRNLAERVACGEFREDLLYRLRVIQIVVPPLRERRDDIPALIEYFLRRAPHTMSCTPEAEAALFRYKWPGNVRELQNVIEQAIWLANAGSYHAGRSSRRAAQRSDGNRPDARAAAAGLGSAVRSAGAGALLVLGPCAPAVPESRSDATRYSRAGLPRAQRHARKLPGGAEAVWNDGLGLLPIP